MSTETRHDPLKRRLLRWGWRSALMGHNLASSLTSGHGMEPRVFYGGARAGDVGGPLVKVKRLQEYFPEHHWTYNLVYTLSNAPYLPSLALDRLKSRNIPIVLNQNGVFYEGWYNGDWRGMNAVMARAYHRADHVFWQSDFCRRAADKFLGERDGPGEILFNAIDTQHFKPLKQVSEHPFTFLITGKIDTHMAYRLDSTMTGLAEARKQGLEAHLNIAGWVSDEAKTHTFSRAKELGIDGAITLLGSYSQENAPEVYASADAYVMTKYLDPCPNTVLEAMSCGLPVLYSHSGGVPELVGPKAGFGMDMPEDWTSIHTPNAKDIGTGMLTVAENAGNMGQIARQRAIETFDVQHWIKRHRAIFQQLLG